MSSAIAWPAYAVIVINAMSTVALAAQVAFGVFVGMISESLT